MADTGLETLRGALEAMGRGAPRPPQLTDTVLRQLALGAPELTDAVESVRAVYWRPRIAEAYKLFKRQFVTVEVSCIVPIPVRHVYPAPQPFKPVDTSDRPLADLIATDPESGEARHGQWSRFDAMAEAAGSAMARISDVATRRFGTGRESRIDVKYQRAARNAADVDTVDARDTLNFALAELANAYKRRADPAVVRGLADCVAQAAREYRDALAKRAEIIGPQRYKRGAFRRAWLKIQYELESAVYAGRAPIVTIPRLRSAWHRAHWCRRVSRRADGYALGATTLQVATRPLELSPADASADRTDMGRIEALARYLNRVFEGRGITSRVRFNLTTRGDRQRQTRSREDREAKRAAAARLLDLGDTAGARRLIGVA
jgi:hypothetical protein